MIIILCKKRNKAVAQTPDEKKKSARNPEETASAKKNLNHEF